MRSAWFLVTRTGWQIRSAKPYSWPEQWPFHVGDQFGGVAAVVLKPFEIDQLTAVVSQALSNPCDQEPA